MNPRGTLPLIGRALAGLFAFCALPALAGEVSITCPANIVVNNDPDACGAVVSFADPVAGTTATSITLSLEAGLPSGSEFPVGITTVTFLATDDEGDTAQCSFTVEVVDNQDPVVECGPEFDVTVSSADGACAADVTYVLPPGSDNCGIQEIELIAGFPSGSTFPVGETTVDHVYRDAAGNEAFCRIIVTVLDSSGLPLTCPDNITVGANADCQAVVTYDTPVPEDLCNGYFISQTAGLPSGSAFPLGTTTQTFVAQNLQGNELTCSFTVTVIDTTGPVFRDCPANISVSTDPASCETTVVFPTPSAIDNCSGSVPVTQTEGPVSGSAFPVGETTVSFEAEDAEGNSTTCTFVVEVTDNENPVVLTCPGDVVAAADDDACGTAVSFDPPTAQDNCGDVNVTQTEGPASGSFFPVGITPVEFAISDDSGNEVLCAFTVTVNDETPPVVVGPDTVLLPTDPDLCTATAVIQLPTVSDNCALQDTTQITGPSPGDVLNIGFYNLEFTFTDTAGNLTTFAWVLEVADTQLPEITCPDNIDLTISGGACDTVVTWLPPTIADNCPGVAFTQLSGPNSGDLLAVGNYQVVYEVVDAAGNTVQCTQTIAITESVEPVFTTCPANITVSADEGACSAVVTYTAPAATDNCSNPQVELTSGLASGDEFPVGITTVVYTATDDEGNAAECSFQVEVTDDEAPVLSCPDTLHFEVSAGCSAQLDFDLPSASDNCDASPSVSQVSGPASGSTQVPGVYEAIFEAEDDAGNTTSCTVQLVVEDTTPPVFENCVETLNLEAGSDCIALLNLPFPEADDACEFIVVQVAGPLSGTQLAPGDYTSVFVTEDIFGNSDTCTVQISVIEQFAPQFDVCPEDITTCDETVEFAAPTASDNCSEVTVTQIAGLPSGSVFPVGITEQLYVAEDEAGNTDTCRFFVERVEGVGTVSASRDTLLCDETSVLLEASVTGGFGEINWSVITPDSPAELSDPTSAQPTLANLPTGETQVEVIFSGNPLCPISRDTVTVTVGDLPQLTLSGNASIQLGQTVPVEASASVPGTFAWAPPDGLSCNDCASPQASPTSTTQYVVLFTSAEGCTATDSLLIRVFTDRPNAFTPDGDGTNDVWNIPGIQLYPQARIEIFNRWGQRVYESTNGYQTPWDGTFNGEELPAASYFYSIDYGTGSQEPETGTVTLIR